MRTGISRYGKLATGAVRRLVDSPLLDPVPELSTEPQNAVIITPASYVSAAELWAAEPSRDWYLFTPGDYRGWGDSALTGMSGTAGSRRMLCYYDPETPGATHPVRRDAQAVFSGLQIDGGSSHWLLHGLTFDREGLNGQSALNTRPGSDHVVIDMCLFQNFLQGGVIHYGSYNYTQRTVARWGQLAGFDTYGIMVTPQQGNPVIGCRTLDCEVYDCVDMLAATVSSLPGDAWTEVGDYVIDGCDLYNSPAYVKSGPKENITDFKTGSDTRRNYVRNSRMWGLAFDNEGGSGGSNHMMVFHRGARNWTVEDCILGENSSEYAAFYESVWQSQDLPEGYTTEDVFGPRGIVFRRNVVYGHRGAAFGCSLDGQMIDNELANCGQLFYRSPASGRHCPTDPVIAGNKYRGLHALYDPADPENPPYDPALNAKLPGRHFYYERRRWTGPEIARAW